MPARQSHSVTGALVALIAAAALLAAVALDVAAGSQSEPGQHGREAAPPAAQR